jgi:UDP-glucose 4-epimerase
MSKKAIVLGGSGFIGRSLVLFLSDLGYVVENWDIKEPTIHQNLWKSVDLRNISVSHRDALQSADLIVHLAGISEIAKADQDEILAYEVNVMGTLKLVNLLNSAPKANLVFASSIYAEGSAGGAYGRTKKAAEDIVKSYRGPFQILRFGSVYGPNASKTSGLVGILSQLQNSSSVTYAGDGREIRNYLHVDDLVEVIHELILSEERWGKTTIIQGQDQFDQQRLFSILEEIIGAPIKVTFLERGQHNRYSSTPIRLEDIPKVIRPRIQRDFYSSVLMIMKALQKNG